CCPLQCIGKTILVDSIYWFGRTKPHIPVFCACRRRKRSTRIVGWSFCRQNTGSDLATHVCSRLILICICSENTVGCLRQPASNRSGSWIFCEAFCSAAVSHWNSNSKRHQALP